MVNKPAAALFLDRDGVIIENRADYVRSWSDVEFLPHAIEALVTLSDSSYQLIIVTNQSAVGRGILTRREAEEINEMVVDVIEAAGGRIDAAYICPHAPADQCECRKPLPGLLLQATADLNLDLKRSIMIGDALSDMAAGQAAGVGQTVLVRTGRGYWQENLPEAAELDEFEVHDSLAAFLVAFQIEATSDDP